MHTLSIQRTLSVHLAEPGYTTYLPLFLSLPPLSLSFLSLSHVGIFLAGFHVSLDAIDPQLNKIEEGNDNGGGGLELDHIVAMKRFAQFFPLPLICYFPMSYHRFQPSVEDREMYKRYKGDKNQLQSGDQFLMKVCIHLSHCN